MKLEVFKEIVEEAGYELESYSGRGMYGDECASLRLDRDESVFVVMASITEAAFSRHEYDGDIKFDIGEWLELMGKTKTDNMGLGMVIYWKHMKWDDSDEPEDD